MGDGSAADARRVDRAPRDSAFDLVDVPATVVCAACGDPGCPGCAAEEPTNQSGVVAIIPWERPGLGFWRRVWQTATLATVHARTFFSAIPDGDISSALSFALVCEALAVTGLGIGAGLIALLALPSLPVLLLEDAHLRSSLVRGVGFGGFLVVLAMVGLHALHGAALDMAARRFGGRASGRGLRFGLYACGWDLITLPFGLLATALISGFGAARRAAPLGLTAPLQAAEAYLVGHHALSPDSARAAARRAAYLTALPFIVVIALGVVGAALAIR
jgi:hypothetical protein